MKYVLAGLLMFVGSFVYATDCNVQQVRVQRVVVQPQVQHVQQVVEFVEVPHVHVQQVRVQRVVQVQQVQDHHHVQQVQVQKVVVQKQRNQRQRSSSNVQFSRSVSRSRGR